MGFVKGVGLSNDPNRDVGVLLAMADFSVSYFCVSGVRSVLFPCFWLSVPVQLIAFKDSSPI